MDFLLLPLGVVLFVVPPHVGVWNLFCNTMCEVWIWWTIIDCCNLPLIITSNVLWCAHVSTIYWTFCHYKLQNFTLIGIVRIVCCCHYTLFYLWHHHTSRFYNRSWHTMCDIWIGWTMINGCNFHLIVASNVLWCTHVSPIYWTFSHLKLQRFTFTGILWIVCCCQLAMFYLWCHRNLGFCNLYCDTMCEVLIGWTMFDRPNLHLIVASNALWHALVLPIY